MRLIGRAASGGEMLAQFRTLRPDLVLIAGDVDGCHGVRVAGALARHRCVPMLLAVEPGAEAEARQECQRREVEADVVACSGSMGDGVAQALLALSADLLADSADPDVTSVRGELVEVAAEGFDATVLVGSAGTPHLLPELLGPRKGREIPLVIALHHNPRLSDAFCDWVGELAELVPQPLSAIGGGGLPRLTVAGASPCSGDGLEPDLDGVVDRVCNGGRRLFIGVGSGMGVTGVGALRRARAYGGVVAVIDPASCSQPGMPAAVIGAGLADHVVTIAELSWLIAYVSTVDALPLAASM
jgi:chemotaxis response regulator CheB